MRVLWKRALLIACVVVALADAARADEWTRADTAWEAGFATALLVDWQQTRYNLRAAGGYERNPIVGRYPSGARINIMALSALAGHAIVAGLLPQPYRRGWQAVALMLEIGAVSDHAIAGGGLNLSFTW